MSRTPHTTLITAADLQALLASGESCVVFDARFELSAPEQGRAQYLHGHIPQAQYLDLDGDLSGPRTGSNGRHPLPSKEQLAQRLGAMGVRSSPPVQVVIYDAQGGMFAARAWWLLRWLGHSQVAVLDGGLQAWIGAGGVLEQQVQTPEPAQFDAAAPLVDTVNSAAVVANLANNVRLVVDARAAERFRGENETLDPVGGHIPGAVNRCFQLNLQDGFFKPAAQLRQEFQQLLDGRAPSALVSQCGSGVTACHNLLAMTHAGLEGGVLYPGSWSEWVADPHRPVATGT